MGIEDDKLSERTYKADIARGVFAYEGDEDEVFNYVEIKLEGGDHIILTKPSGCDNEFWEVSWFELASAY